jgi:hypothetical protein
MRQDGIIEIADFLQRVGIKSSADKVAGAIDEGFSP